MRTIIGTALAVGLALSGCTDKDAQRTNLLCSLSEDELSPAALAARVVLVDCVRELVQSGAWSGTSPIHHDN